MGTVRTPDPCGPPPKHRHVFFTDLKAPLASAASISAAHRPEPEPSPFPRALPPQIPPFPPNPSPPEPSPRAALAGGPRRLLPRSPPTPVLHRRARARAVPSPLGAASPVPRRRETLAAEPAAAPPPPQSLDVCMNKQHRMTGSSPDQLLVQIKNACRRHGARIAGENASLVMTHTSSFSRIRSNILTAERMGAEFFSPEHWPQFTEFVRSVVCGEWDEERGMAAASRNAREAQAV